MICITHDVRDTQDFERVLVLDRGRIVEDGRPDELASHEGCLYRRLLDAERAVHEELWSGAIFRSLRLDRGRLAARRPLPPLADERELREVAQ